MGAKFGGRVCLALSAGLAVLAMTGCSLLPAGEPVASTETLAAGITPNKEPLPDPSDAADDAAGDSADGSTGDGTGSDAGDTDEDSTEPAEPAAPAEKTAVTPLIVSSSWDAASDALSVDAFVSGVTEDGGACSLVAELDGTVVSADSTSFASAQSTECGELAIAGSDLASGTWSVHVEYASDRYAGVSDSVDVEVTR